MSFEVRTTEYFEKRFKRLSKKHKSLIDDISRVADQLSENPRVGTSIGKGCYKIRIAVSSKGKGKSGGTRLITYILFANNTVYLVDIFDKSEQATIQPQELQNLINKLP